ncbi:hypothetical protein [Loktanella sp. SALINAS62]|uniref:hypothetical protein n=1 Tax=Loktanella sp. SALINAS62 TaxID=2706124 RepID=UPI001B8BCFB2|nr:hypothetical protein [Loktanella sp. SALINAS62]MBS1301912.1 hypothetical protein [Loktanella sp. SALINAS62]
MTFRPTILAVLALAACSDPMNPDPLSDGVRQTGIAFNEAFRDTPLDDGPISIIVNDPDPLRTLLTYTLSPCRNGTEVCGGSETGPVAQIAVMDGQYVVANAYPGLTFYLDPNGDGFLKRGNTLTPLAWD